MADKIIQQNDLCEKNVSGRLLKVEVRLSAMRESLISCIFFDNGATCGASLQASPVKYKESGEQQGQN